MDNERRRWKKSVLALKRAQGKRLQTPPGYARRCEAYLTKKMSGTQYAVNVDDTEDDSNCQSTATISGSYHNIVGASVSPRL